MAVNIDTVYQRVLALANKEQRGYITPQEFNIFANQAQMDIYEQYFYDLNQWYRPHGNNTISADPIDIVEGKLNLFLSSESLEDNGGGTPANVFDLADLTGNFYRINTVLKSNVALEEVRRDEFSLLGLSALTTPTTNTPVFYRKGTLLVVAPTSINDTIDVNYYKKPTAAVWGYTVVNSKALYDSGSSTNFELEDSEETKLVIKILALAGITLNDPALYQIATAEDNKNVQQEKQ